MRGKQLLYLSLLLVLTAVFLTGCLQVNINIGIDYRFNSYLTYDIKMDVSDVDKEYQDVLANALNRLGWYYQEDLDFTVGLNTDSEIYTLVMSKSIENASLQEAFYSLESLLTDEDITPFVSVDMVFESFPRQESYSVSALLDIPLIIERTGAQELTPELLAELDKAMETSGGTIELTLPASEIITYSHDVEMLYDHVLMTAPVMFDRQTEVYFRGDVIYSEDGVQIGTTDETVENLEKNKNIVFIVSGSVIALLLIILLGVLLKRRR